MAVKKERIDKYYRLAKEKGYRSRAAFKLQELNKKYRFIDGAHIAVDLCAAPGGWMQILLQEMSQPRKVVGIDLDFIPPLGIDAVSFIGDITTIECRRRLVEILDGNYADIFVHDGAPNFGASGEKDRFVQNDLVLHALKLTCEFLKKGGVFVTKIFRSENFLKIRKVLEDLFSRVEVTKPMSSRSESAEIFAVCLGYKRPEYIDGSLFDSNVIFIDKEDDIDEYKKILLSDFIRSKENKLLYECGSIIVDFECPLITSEMKEMFKDMKLLHKNDFKKICQKKRQIVSAIKNGNLQIDILSDLKETPEIKEYPDEELEYDKIADLKSKLEKLRKNENNNLENIKKIDDVISEIDGNLENCDQNENNKLEFFNDRIFQDLDSKEYSVEEENIEKIEVSSCSDSLSMTESEMRCLIQMKEDGLDKFEENTIDKYILADGDIALENEKRVLRLNMPKIKKKKMELLSRKMARAQRRAAKKISDIVLENEEEEAIVYKKIFKNNLKKEKVKKKILFGNKIGPRFTKPRFKGKVILVDRRMKHDLRIQRKRARNKR